MSCRVGTVLSCSAMLFWDTRPVRNSTNLQEASLFLEKALIASCQPPSVVALLALPRGSGAMPTLPATLEPSPWNMAYA